MLRGLRFGLPNDALCLSALNTTNFLCRMASSQPKQISGRLVFDREELDKVLANGDYKKGERETEEGKDLFRSTYSAACAKIT